MIVDLATSKNEKPTELSIVMKTIVTVDNCLHHIAIFKCIHSQLIIICFYLAGFYTVQQSQWNI